MALVFDREKYQKMVNYIRGGAGSVLSVYPPKPGQMARNYKKNFVPVILATENPEQFLNFVSRYCESYNLYPDLPIIELNQERTLLQIKPSYNDYTTKKSIIHKNKFYTNE